MTTHTTLYAALFTAAVLGFRHGFDYDHIAAITDVVSVQSSKRVAMKLGMVYALGHALTVAGLGSIVILLGISLPAGIDRWAERLVGFTLLLLGIYVLGTLVLRPDDTLPKSRYMLLHAGYHRARLALKRREEGCACGRICSPKEFRRTLCVCDWHHPRTRR